MNSKKLKKLKWLVLSQKRWRKKLRRQRTKNRVKNHTNTARDYTRKLNQNIEKKKKNHVVSGESLSISSNTIKTISFLHKIHMTLKRCMPVYIDVSKVKNITVDTLLYLLATLDNIKNRNIPIHLEGNLPRQGKAHDIFVQSGFLSYMESKKVSIANSADCFKIYDGSNADGQVAKKLCQFTMDKLKIDRIATMGLYEIIMEIIINTKQHAYYSKMTNLPKWYAYARYEPERGIFFSILDTGVGIPKTIRKNFREKINEFVVDLPLIRNSDSNLLKSVLDGKFRTKTKMEYRGKGIPMIVEHNRTNYIQNLTVVSNYGFAKVGDSNLILPKPLNGTLYSWEMSDDN